MGSEDEIQRAFFYASMSAQNVAKRLVLKKRLHLTYIYGTYVRTFEQEEKKVSREFKYLKLPCPKFKRGRQMANVTARVWLRDS